MFAHLPIIDWDFKSIHTYDPESIVFDALSLSSEFKLYNNEVWIRLERRLCKCARHANFT